MMWQKGRGRYIYIYMEKKKTGNLNSVSYEIMRTKEKEVRFKNNLNNENNRIW